MTKDLPTNILVTKAHSLNSLMTIRCNQVSQQWIAHQQATLINTIYRVTPEKGFNAVFQEQLMFRRKLSTKKTSTSWDLE
jgi:hypothetical protein